MLVDECKLKAKPEQYAALDAAIRTGLFIRNACIRYWMDGKDIGKNSLSAYCKVLADHPEFPWAKQLNSMARQAHAERAWFAISRFFDNCAKKKPGKKGYPKFKKNQNRGSVEYKTSGWKLSEDRKYITFTDGFKAGRFKLLGSRDLGYYQPKKDIKRVRVIRRSDGYYVQFCIKCDRKQNVESTGRAIGLDVGLKEFYTRHLRKLETPFQQAVRGHSLFRRAGRVATDFQGFWAFFSKLPKFVELLN